MRLSLIYYIHGTSIRKFLGSSTTANGTRALEGRRLLDKLKNYRSTYEPRAYTTWFSVKFSLKRESRGGSGILLDD